jgi:hypothetical protein
MNKINNFPKETRGPSHCALAIYIKNILRQKINDGNSNISPCKNIIFKKSSKRNQNPSRYYNFITKGIQDLYGLGIEILLFLKIYKVLRT